MYSDQKLINPANGPELRPDADNYRSPKSMSKRAIPGFIMTLQALRNLFPEACATRNAPKDFLRLV